MSKDTIYREDAIKALRKLGHEVVVIDKVCSLGVAVEFIDAIRAVPSADRPRGEWIDDTEHTEHYWANCSICGLQIDVHENRGYHNFCPNCGARMKGADDGE